MYVICISGYDISPRFIDDKKTKFSVKSALTLIDTLDIDNNIDIHLGVSSYADDTQTEVSLKPPLRNDLKSAITKVKVRQSNESNVTDALHHGYTQLNNYGMNSKRIVVLFSDGKYSNTIQIKDRISKFYADNIVVIVISIGEDFSYTGIRDIVSDSFYAIYTPDQDDHSPYLSVKSEVFEIFC